MAGQGSDQRRREGNYDREGTLIRQRTTDPKCILVIGDDSAFSGSDAEREAKFRTFELFRRDSRNIGILTYSELYERAAFVVGRSARQADAYRDNVTEE
ncbi:Shedu anti-phage system protein SduA domain-containing protein [Sinorhizobium meliloti]|uniref:Shedu anti-phage system protein SduA domain-containing protein n=1 Tax=Rhizobium meliloti TaxID=382 RepID=UPI0012974E24|nr:Shedu anti-phage system protein SduA domain-containing protein [Sinorhizobium meliloti]MDW9378026.1 DUF4263 domain-containing protein [Sinorhizobium meliloti]MDW9496627.1 DUF4263 domain-containing protein [Sinorhizobium meliloti]MDW9565179.1 DUF4263 domain-containing protein [Sinorhizobium meliloti]MDW9652605.1 DUF4263 domain-containing protein [Sinorhizobium meliloti]MDW9862813.1 DUF4263 domain-containing protein [Sinorhizobium meliloti]